MNTKQFSPKSLMPFSTRFSNYARQRYAAQPVWLERLDVNQPWSIQRMHHRLSEILSPNTSLLDIATLEEADLSAGLRQLRQEVLLSVMERDLAGQADLGEVTRSMTWLAEFAVQTALQWASHQLATRYGIPQDSHQQPVDLLVIGMGKLGGAELNVSSDIDLIFVYTESGHTHHGTLSNHEFFDRIGRKLITLLSEVTAEGMVFRVDMRLRPQGDSGPLVCSLNALETYLISQGREWERYAWLKARVVSQAVFQIEHPALWQQGLQQLDQLIRPFVYRRYLDFGAIEALRDLHGKIKQELGRRGLQHSALRQHNGQLPGQDNSTNIKLGRGGIREIEFITQVFQLIRGGREKTLRERSTQIALELCATRGLMEPECASKLLNAYRFLRHLEHCLQYRDDAQTHTLPDDPEQQANLAAMMHLPFETWQQQLAEHRHFVMQQFDQIFGHKHNARTVASPPATTPAGEEAPAAHLMAQMDTRLEHVRNGSKYQALPEAHRQRFERLLLAATLLCTTHPQPLETLHRVLELLEAIARRGAYLSLLCEFPPAFERVVRLLASSSWAASYLIRHPLLLDELIDIRTLYDMPNLAEFETQLRQQLAHHPDDAERQMNLMREAHHAQVFRLLLQDIEGQLSIEKLADYLSELADRILRLSLEQVWNFLRQSKDIHHNWPDQPHFAVIAYGKLGGKELGYASDLDLIFLYEDDHADAQEHYARLAQRLSSWLSSQTTSGLLFEIDLRLRPNGNAGLLVSSLPAFIRYQQETAWEWEHQALTRARFCAGDAAIGTAFEAARRAILQQPRSLEKLKQEVLSMRQKMHLGHPNPGPLFDLKHDHGGMVDIEFAVQYLVLAHSARFPELTQNLGNIALLKHCASHQLLPTAVAERAANAYRHFRALQHQLRLDNQPYARVEENIVADDRTAVIALWQTLFEIPADTVK